jgi:hypothetical protein
MTAYTASVASARAHARSSRCMRCGSVAVPRGTRLTSVKRRSCSLRIGFRDLEGRRNQPQPQDRGGCSRRPQRAGMGTISISVGPARTNGSSAAQKTEHNATDKAALFLLFLCRKEMAALGTSRKAKLPLQSQEPATTRIHRIGRHRQLVYRSHNESCSPKDVGRVTSADGARAVPAGRGSSPPLPGG